MGIEGINNNEEFPQVYPTGERAKLKEASISQDRYGSVGFYILKWYISL